VSYPQQVPSNCGSGLPAHPETANDSAMSLIDGCPECVHNTEPPKSAARVADGWFTAYSCSDCGHAWTTSWKD
jgi:hypothetical protein